jgi:uncharacterized membrane protein
MNRSLEWLTLGTAVGCAVSGGVFFAFSAFVMPALGRLPKPQAIAAFQSINRMAVTPALMIVLFGTALACVAVGIWAIAGDGSSGWLLAGCSLFLAGAIVVTIAANVPLNDSLATVDPGSAGAADAWASFQRRWTAWNHVRTVTSIAAGVLLMVGARFG